MLKLCMARCVLSSDFVTTGSHLETILMVLQRECRGDSHSFLYSSYSFPICPHILYSPLSANKLLESCVHLVLVRQHSRRQSSKSCSKVISGRYFPDGISCSADRRRAWKEDVGGTKNSEKQDGDLEAPKPKP